MVQVVQPPQESQQHLDLWKNKLEIRIAAKNIERIDHLESNRPEIYLWVKMLIHLLSMG